MMQTVCARVRELTAEGGAIYFWTKRTSAVPNTIRFGKQYQIIAFATKGKRPRVFNRLRIDLPLRPEHRYSREDGVFVTDVWDDIRELTSGYFAGDEALRDNNGERIHKQQSPVALLLRIILSINPTWRSGSRSICRDRNNLGCG